MRLLVLQAIHRRAHAGVGRTRLNEIAPAFNHDLKRLKRPSRYDRRRDHHTAGHAAVQCQIRAHAQNDDLRDQAGKLRRTTDPEIPLQRAALEYQRSGLIATPMQNALVQHPHGVDDLGIARQRFRLGIRSRCVQIRMSQRTGGCLLVHERDGDEHKAGHQTDKAQSRMNEKHRAEIDRRQRDVEQQQHDGT